VTLSAHTALAAGADIGGFFAVDADRAGPGWRRWGDLAGRPPVLAEQVALARAGLAGTAGLAAGDIEPRVAASVWFLGVAARVVAPPLAGCVLADALPRVTPAMLWWRPVAGDLWALAVDPVVVDAVGTAGTVGTVDAPADAPAFAATVVAGLLAPLVEAVATGWHVSRRVLWGDAASAVGGAAAALAAGRPDRAAGAAVLAAGVLDLGPLRGTLDGAGVRRSCCLLYRVPGRTTCGDCVLTTR